MPFAYLPLKAGILVLDSAHATVPPTIIRARRRVLRHNIFIIQKLFVFVKIFLIEGLLFGGGAVLLDNVLGTIGGLYFLLVTESLNLKPTNVNAFLDVNLVIILLHLLVQIGLLVVDDLLQPLLHLRHPLHDIVYFRYLTIYFLDMFADAVTLLYHLLQQLIFNLFRVVFDNLHHY